MKLKILKSYKLMGKTVKVKLIDTQDYAGLYDPDKHTIYLSINQSDEQLEESFWHEMNHCMQFLSGVNQAVSRELLEIMAEMNSRITAKIIRDS